MLLGDFFIQHYTMSISSLKLLKTHLGLLNTDHAHTIQYQFNHEPVENRF